MGAPSPRYFAEHFLMPRFLAERGATAVLAAIDARDAEFFIPVWMEAGFRFTPTFLSTSQDAWRIGLLTFPKPRQMTEAYFGVVVGRSDEPSFLRYFLLEESVQNTTVVGESREGRHVNYGSGPQFSGDLATDAWSFTQRVVEILERERAN